MNVNIGLVTLNFKHTRRWCITQNTQLNKLFFINAKKWREKANSLLPLARSLQSHARSADVDESRSVDVASFVSLQKGSTKWTRLSSTKAAKPFPGELTFISKCDYCSRLWSFPFSTRRHMYRETIHHENPYGRRRWIHRGPNTNRARLNIKATLARITTAPKATLESINWAAFSSRVGRCPMRPGKRSSSWLIRAPDRATFQESFRCPMVVCPRSWDGITRRARSDQKRSGAQNRESQLPQSLIWWGNTSWNVRVFSLGKFAIDW